MQKDIVLRLPLCSMAQIEACEDPLSRAKLFDENMNEVLDGDRPKRICEVAVPGACPRIKCEHKPEDGKPVFLACRMQALIQTVNGSGSIWMKLPCSECNETRKLHPNTEAFVYGEDAGPNQGV